MRTLLAAGWLLLPLWGLATDLPRPLTLRNHRPLSLPFYRFEPTGLPDRPPISISLTGANELRFAGDGIKFLQEDVEIWRMTLDFSAPLAGTRHRWFLQVPLVSYGGGFMDPMIDAWHDLLLGWSDPHRDGTPRHRAFVQTTRTSFGAGEGLGDVALGLSRRTGDFRIGFALKFPTGSPGLLTGSGGWDAGASLEYAERFHPRWSVHAMLGLVYQGSAWRLPEARTWIDQQSLAFIYEPNATEDWILQWQSEASSLRTGIASSDATHRILSFGYRKRLPKGQTLEVYVSEDKDLFSGYLPELASVGPDFAVGLRWTLER